MEIQWHGLSCVSIKGKDATVLIDPYDQKATGLKLPDLKPDVVLLNGENPLHSYPASDDIHLFDWPGEFEGNGVLIDAVTAHDRPREKDDAKKDDAQLVHLYAFNVDDFRVCHLSNLGHKLTPEMLEKLGSIDVLILPVGGGKDTMGCLDAEKAQEVIEQIEPRIVIPMMYDCGQKGKLNGVSAFLKEVGATAVQSEKSYKVVGTSNLPVDQTEFKLLEPVLG